MYQRHSFAGSLSIQFVRSKYAPLAKSLFVPFSNGQLNCSPTARCFSSFSTTTSKSRAAAGFRPCQRPIRRSIFPKSVSFLLLSRNALSILSNSSVRRFICRSSIAFSFSPRA